MKTAPCKISRQAMNQKRLNPLLIAGFLTTFVAVLVVIAIALIPPAQTKAPPCAAESDGAYEPPPALALMSGLPVYWPLGVDFNDLASGAEDRTWQSVAIAPCYTLLPIDTLAPVPALSPQAPNIDPLAGQSRLAIIQPRGLSPQDNVALDDWVRAGGALLIVLDPALTGEYELPLGDPRLPTMSALIPPVIERWGLAISFDETQELVVKQVNVADFALPLDLPGQISAEDGSCEILAEGALARCGIGEGRVTVLADAAVFEHQELAGEDGANLIALLRYAFEDR